MNCRDMPLGQYRITYYWKVSGNQVYQVNESGGEPYPVEQRANSLSEAVQVASGRPDNQDYVVTRVIINSRSDENNLVVKRGAEGELA